MGRGKL